MECRRYPSAVTSRFWNVDPEDVDPVVHRDFVMERVMTRGTWDAMRWLLSAYSKEDIGSYVQRNAHRLPRREAVYWALMAGVALPPRNNSVEGYWSSR